MKKNYHSTKEFLNISKTFKKEIEKSLKLSVRFINIIYFTKFIVSLT